MPRKNAFSISDFAKLSRTKRDTLLFYDKMELLKPNYRGKNGYRFYSAGQVAAVNLIRTAQRLGFSLVEIKDIIKRRTPAMMDELLRQQIARIDERINEWMRARKLLYVLQKMIHSAIVADKDSFSVEFLPAEAIVLGDVNDYSRERSDYDALLSFYQACTEKYPDMDLNYPVWGIVSEERIRRGDWHWPDRFYFHNPDGYDRRPGALYAIGYCYGDYGETGALYKRLLSYIEKNGYEICGPAYEEYPLNELCVAEVSNYLIRLMITVKKAT